MFTEIFIIIVLLLVLLVMISFTLGSKRYKDVSQTPSPIQEHADTKPCPLCQRALTPGERVHSVVFNEKEDRLMNIFGCSWCFDKHPTGAHSPLRKRTCPSCKLNLPQGSYAIARVFERQGKKTHIHVLGCPTCRKRKDWI